MQKLYFAHPVNIYGQEIEASFERLIAYSLLGSDRSLIENPNQPHHQVGYDKYAQRLKESGMGHKGMRYFYDEVLPNCYGCVGVPFLDGRLGLGVAGEMRETIECDKQVHIVAPRWPFTLEDVERFTIDPIDSCFFVRAVTDLEKQMLIFANPELVVPHEETRLRTWRVYNQERRPYEEAHLVKMPVPEGFYPKG